jgi:hypothetical protein
VLLDQGHFNPLTAVGECIDLTFASSSPVVVFAIARKVANAYACLPKGHDLTKNGLAIPVVDELATIPLNLWAEENGYK